ncbi:MAG: ImmA/IrrE family metallo-endopeptidase, partial [Candidatus Aminicenantes bacterium]|nr:ImmA/IrrE family metallo-endopeptidase [Candidatus Aminicenantes bacterium]
LRTILKEFQNYCQRYTELEEITERSLQTAPLYTHLSAERMTDQERQRMGPGRFLTGRLFDTLELNGLRICRQVYPKEGKTAGVFVFLERKQAAFVSINAHLPEERQHMVAAHAYAHYLRDRLDGPVVDNLDIFIPEYLSLYPGRETYAQTFARNFLLPKHQVLDILDNDLHVKNPDPADIHYIRRLFAAPGDEVLQVLYESGRIPKSSLQRMRRHFPHLLRDGQESAIQNEGDNPAEESLRPSYRYRNLCVSAYRRKKIDREQMKDWLYGANPASEIEENPDSDPEKGN